jgi:hypothetical protein
MLNPFKIKPQKNYILMTGVFLCVTTFLTNPSATGAPPPATTVSNSQATIVFENISGSSAEVVKSNSVSIEVPKHLTINSIDLIADFVVTDQYQSMDF